MCNTFDKHLLRKTKLSKVQRLWNYKNYKIYETIWPNYETLGSEIRV